MQTAPPPQSPSPQVKPHSRQSGYWGLALTALIAGIFGIGVGTALRFQVVPAVTDTSLSPDQAFPPLTDWPPQVPSENQPRRDADDTPPRRLLPAAEAATSRPANTASQEDASRRAARATPPETYTSPSITSERAPAQTENIDGRIDTDKAELGAALDNLDNLAQPNIESRFSEDATAPMGETMTESFTDPLEPPQPRFDRETSSSILEAPNQPRVESMPPPLSPTPARPTAPSDLGSTLRLPEKSRPALPLAPAPLAPTPNFDNPPAIEEE